MMMMKMETWISQLGKSVIDPATDLSYSRSVNKEC